jgi:cytoskeleton protein RodZ
LRPQKRCCKVSLEALQPAIACFPANIFLPQDRPPQSATERLTLFRAKPIIPEGPLPYDRLGDDDVMPSFGENLRREREMRAVTLEEMSETTKISIRLLRALEQERFAELPGGVFTRSFIRAYAQYLGLDEEHVLSEYKRAAKPSTDNDLSRLTPARAFSDKGPRTRVLPWVIIAALVGSGYAVYRYSRRSLETAASGRSPALSTGPGSAETAPPAATASDAGQGGNQPADPNSPARSTATQNAPDPNASGAGGTGAESIGAGGANESPVAPGSSGARSAEGANAGAQVLGEGDMVLQVTTSEEAWIAVAADGKTLLQHRLPANSVRIFRARDGFDVTTGNAQGTVLTFNGAAQKSLGREGEFKRIHLARSSAPSAAH